MAVTVKYGGKTIAALADGKTATLKCAGLPMGHDLEIIADGADETYTGDYSVTPSHKEDIVLDTDYKELNEDIVIKKVPYKESTDTNGALTITIGE